MRALFASFLSSADGRQVGMCLCTEVTAGLCVCVRVCVEHLVCQHYSVC